MCGQLTLFAGPYSFSSENMDFNSKIINAKSISDIFEIVKEMVYEYLGAEQAGLMVGVTDLGSYQNGFIGAFYSLNANAILINKRPLARILQTNPSMYNYYLFHVMLHEYIHSIGSYDEVQTKLLVHEISSHYFGNGHVVTQLASNIEKFIPNLAYPNVEGFQEPESINIEFVKGIDRKNINYIN